MRKFVTTLVLLALAGCGDASGEIRTYALGVMCNVRGNEIDASIKVFGNYEEIDVRHPVLGGIFKDVDVTLHYEATACLVEIETLGSTSSWEKAPSGKCELDGKDGRKYVMEMNRENKLGKLHISNGIETNSVDLQCADYFSLINSYH